MKTVQTREDAYALIAELKEMNKEGKDDELVTKVIAMLEWFLRLHTT